MGGLHCLLLKIQCLMLFSCCLQRIEQLDGEIKYELQYIKDNFKDVITYKVSVKLRIWLRIQPCHDSTKNESNLNPSQMDG